MATYRILDEPRPGVLGNYAVNPLWPLLGLMLAGWWLSWPWFLFNSLALGGSARRRELALLAVGAAGAVALVLAILLTLGERPDLPKVVVPLALLGVTVWKIAIAYFLQSSQGRSFALLEHFGGGGRSGFPLLVIGYLATAKLLDIERLGAFLYLVLR